MRCSCSWNMMGLLARKPGNPSWLFSCAQDLDSPCKSSNDSNYQVAFSDALTSTQDESTALGDGQPGHFSTFALEGIKAVPRCHCVWEAPVEDAEHHNQHGSKFNHQGTTGFSLCFHFPEFHFGYLAICPTSIAQRFEVDQFKSMMVQVPWLEVQARHGCSILFLDFTRGSEVKAALKKGSFVRIRGNMFVTHLVRYP